MDRQPSRLKEQVKKIDSLRNTRRWGPEYQLWEKTTERAIRDFFDEDALKLFKQQETKVFFEDEEDHQQQYLQELNNRKQIIEGLLAESKEYLSHATISSEKQKEPSKQISQEKPWKKNPLVIVGILGVLATMLAAFISSDYWAPKIDQLFSKASIPPISLPQSPNDESKVLDRSIFQLVAETDYTGAILSVQKRWEGFKGLKTQDEHATIMNYGDGGSGKTWVYLKSIDSDENAPGIITCIFDDEWRQKIELLGEDSEREIIFGGTIRGDLTEGYVPMLKDCSIKEQQN